MPSEKISYPLIGVLAKFLDTHYTRKEIERLFHTANAPGDAPLQMNKLQTVMEWLKRTNRESPDPLRVLGQLLEETFEGSPATRSQEALELDRDKLRDKLSEGGLCYVGGNVVAMASSVATRSLDTLLREREFPAVLHEFDRATAKVEPNLARRHQRPQTSVKRFARNIWCSTPRSVHPRRKTSARSSRRCARISARSVVH